MSNKLRIMIADDERPARSFLKNILREFEDAELVGEAENGAEAIEIIKEIKPDLALLDLQMPLASGIDVVKMLRKSQMPLVAFVTAYDEFAVQAFEVNAVDYLLKPIEKARLRETLNRAHERLEQTDSRTIDTANLKAAVADYESASEKSISRTHSDSSARRDFVSSRFRNRVRHRRRRIAAHHKLAKQKIHDKFSLKRYRSQTRPAAVCAAFARRAGQFRNDCANRAAAGRNLFGQSEKRSGNFVEPFPISGSARETA